MKHERYWKRRFERLEQYEHYKAIKVYEKVLNEFRKETRRLEREVKDWYERLMESENVNLADARELLKKEELEEFKWTLDEYIAKGRENAKRPRSDIMRQLENASARVHISHLEAQQTLVAAKIDRLYADYLDDVEEMGRNISRSSYYRTAYEVQKGLNVGWDVTPLSERRLQAVMNKPWAPDGVDFSRRIWRNRNQLINELHTEMTQMYIRGGDPRDAIANIAKKMNVSRSRAGNLIMTESAYFYSASQREMFKDLDVREYQIIATLDNRTSNICREMDLKVFKMSEYNPGTTAPPFHNYCRSATIPYFDDDLMTGGRWARDPLTGKKETREIPKNMSYNEWYKQFATSFDLSGDQQYKRKEYDVSEAAVAFDRVRGGRRTQTTAYRVENATNDLYVAKSVGTPKQLMLHTYDNIIKEVVARLPSTAKKFKLPTVVLTTSSDLSRSTFGSYLSKAGTIFMNVMDALDDPFRAPEVKREMRDTKNNIVKSIQRLAGSYHARSDNYLSTFAHEMGHWYIDQKVKSENPGLTPKELAKEKEKISRKLVADLTKAGYDIGEDVSRYAALNQDDNPEEVFAEVFTRYILGETNFSKYIK